MYLCFTLFIYLFLIILFSFSSSCLFLVQYSTSIAPFPVVFLLFIISMSCVMLKLVLHYIKIGINIPLIFSIHFSSHLFKIAPNQRRILNLGRTGNFWHDTITRYEPSFIVEYSFAFNAVIFVFMYRRIYLLIRMLFYIFSL